MIYSLFKMRRSNDPAAAMLLKRLHKQGYPDLKDLKIERVLLVEGLDKQSVEILWPIFFNPRLETTSDESKLDENQGTIIEVRFQRGITDLEMKSIQQAAVAAKLKGFEWARVSTRYQFFGVDKTRAKEIVHRFLYNKEVEHIMEPGEVWNALRPQGQPGKVELFNLVDMNLESLCKLSEDRRLFMSNDQLIELQKLYKKLARLARDGEIEMTAAAWGDHCNHTTMKALKLFQLIQESTLRIAHPLVVSAFHDNSGVIRFYDGWAINIKGETHIAPSAVATYGGIMTKIGGVIRDPEFTGEGAYPIMASTIMGTADPRMEWKDVPEGALHPLIIVLEAIRGIKDYANPMGIPMAWSKYVINPGNLKCFALGHCVGILPEARAQKGVPQPGDFVFYIGGDRGNDGLHGATFSSAAMTHETALKDGTSVQIGHPIEERVFTEVIPVLRDAGLIRAGTDCGAAGLSSAVGEMGNRTGVWVNLAWVPLKCRELAPFEIWLSESQEGGVLAIPKEKKSQALEILSDYGVPAYVIGVFTDSQSCQVIHDASQDNAGWLNNPTTELRGQVVVDLPYSFLNEDCPLPTIEVRKPAAKLSSFEPGIPANETDWVKLVQRHLGHYNICDQSAAAHQFDQTVQGKTILPYVGGINENMPDELYVSVPIYGKPFAAGFANSVNQFYGDIDAYELGKLMMIQAMTKLVAAGFNPSEIACNVNLYTPRVIGFPEHAWRLKELVQGYCQASVDLGMPVISGKDSSNGLFVKKDGTLVHAPLTVDVAALGRMPDKKRLIPKAFAKPGDNLYLYCTGLRKIGLGGSVFFDLFEKRGNELPLIDTSAYREGMTLYHEMLEKLGWSRAVHSRAVICEGGLIRRIFEMSIGSGLGCQIDIDLSISAGNPLLLLFGELHGAIVFATDSEKCENHLAGFNLHYLGKVIREPRIEVCFDDRNIFSESTEILGQQWFSTFKEIVV